MSDADRPLHDSPQGTLGLVDDDARAPQDPMPAPGELGIKGRRSWKTWQLVVAMIAAGLFGAALNYRTVGGGASTSTPGYKLPAASSSASASSATTTTAPTAKGSSGSTTTTTAAPGAGSTTTSAPTTGSSSPAPAGPAQVLLGPTQMQGNWTSPTFTTTAAGWNIGWAFRCTPAPASGPSFEVFVTPVGGSPSGTPAVNGTGPSGQSVTAQSSLGAQTLVVQAPAGCTWAVKVTGS